MVKRKGISKTGRRAAAAAASQAGLALDIASTFQLPPSNNENWNSDNSSNPEEPKGLSGKHLRRHRKKVAQQRAAANSLAVERRTKAAWAVANKERRDHLKTRFRAATPAILRAAADEIVRRRALWSKARAALTANAAAEPARRRALHRRARLALFSSAATERTRRRTLHRKARVALLAAAAAARARLRKLMAKACAVLLGAAAAARARLRELMAKARVVLLASAATERARRAELLRKARAVLVEVGRAERARLYRRWHAHELLTAAEDREDRTLGALEHAEASASAAARARDRVVERHASAAVVASREVEVSELQGRCELLRGSFAEQQQRLRSLRASLDATGAGAARLSMGLEALLRHHVRLDEQPLHAYAQLDLARPLQRAALSPEYPGDVPARRDVLRFDVATWSDLNCVRRALRPNSDDLRGCPFLLRAVGYTLVEGATLRERYPYSVERALLDGLGDVAALALEAGHALQGTPDEHAVAAAVQRERRTGVDVTHVNAAEALAIGRLMKRQMSINQHQLRAVDASSGAEQNAIYARWIQDHPWALDDAPAAPGAAWQRRDAERRTRHQAKGAPPPPPPPPPPTELPPRALFLSYPTSTHQTAVEYVDALRATSSGAGSCGGGGGGGGGSAASEVAVLEACRKLARQTMRALEHLHRHGCVHGNLAPPNLRVTRDGDLLVTGFEASRAVAKHRAFGHSVRNLFTSPKTPAPRPRTRPPAEPAYAAPELDRWATQDDEDTPPAATAASDVWSAGMLLFRAVAGGEYAGGGVSAERLCAGGEAAAAMLDAMLHPSPAERPSACELLSHAFLDEGALEAMHEHGLVVTDQARHRRTKFASLQSSLERTNAASSEQMDAVFARQGANRFQVAPSLVIGRHGTTLLQMLEIAKGGAHQFRAKLSVSFGDSGSDAGGLTSEFYSRLWEEVATPLHGLFEGGGDGGDGAAPAAVLPVATDTPGTLQQLEGVGVLLAKTLLDGRKASPALSSVVFKFLRAAPAAVTSRDLVAFDPQLARSLFRLTSLDASQLSELGLEYEVGGATVAVDASNVRAYIKHHAQELLVERRLASLVRLRDGFTRGGGFIGAAADGSSFLGLIEEASRGFTCGHHMPRPARTHTTTEGPSPPREPLSLSLSLSLSLLPLAPPAFGPTCRLCFVAAGAPRRRACQTRRASSAAAPPRSPPPTSSGCATSRRSPRRSARG